MRKVFAIVAGVLAILAVFVQPAAAANRAGKGSGTLQIASSTATQIGTVGGDTYFTYTETDVTAGVVAGSMFTAGNFVLHSDGSWTASSTSICTACSIAGRTGDFAMSWDLGGTNLTTFSGKGISVNAAGGLQGLDLTMNPVGSGSSGTYEASYHVDK